MSMLPPTMPIAAVEASVPRSSSSGANTSDGTEFARVLGAAESARNADAPAKADTGTGASGGEAAEETGGETPADEASMDTAAAAANLAAASLVAVGANALVAVTTNDTATIGAAALAVDETSAPVAFSPVDEAAASTTPTSNAPIDIVVDDPTDPRLDDPAGPIDPGAEVVTTPNTLEPIIDNGLGGAPAGIVEQVEGVAPAPETALLESLTQAVTEATTAGSIDAGNTAVLSATEPGILGADGIAAPRTALDLGAPSRISEPAPATPAAVVEAPDPNAPAFRQVLDVVSPLRHRGDGDYRMTLALHPEHLGRVEVAVSLSNGQISMQLNSDSSAARQMLRESMNELRASLHSSGLDTGSLDVGAQDRHGNAGERTAAQASRAAYEGDLIDDDNFFTRLAATAAASTAANTDGPLDVRV